ncbi:MAG: SUMF1/EgtB/PvdO family nonheme iron enzyme [Candidatus Electrothrix sp. YB6]
MLRNPLFFLLFFLSAAAPVQAASPYGRFHALVIGNQNYKYLKPLKTPRADAKAVAKVLKKWYGFEVDLLLDGNREQIMRAISKLRSTMTSEQDNLLIYYAGHGYLDRLSGVGYWQPVDAERDNDVDWIPTSRVTSLLRVIRAKHVLVVADSCYSGNLLMRNPKVRLASGMSRDEWIQRMLARRSRNALTAGGEEPVLDSGGGGHSVFAQAFLRVLRHNQEVLDGDSLFDRIKNPVIANALQTPLYGVIKMTNHNWGDFLLVPQKMQGGNPVSMRTKKSTGSNFTPRGDTAQTYPQEEPEPVPPSPPKRGDTMTDTITGMEFVYIPKGCFQMGSPPDEKDRKEDEGPVHEVCVDGFWMGKYEVTQREWKKIMTHNPSNFKASGRCPVGNVSWEDVQEFISELNRETGKRYRLPTEAEWEYACRAGGSGKYCGGDRINELAWYDGNSGNKTHPVGQKKKNAFGLYDMSGNAWEWCADWYSSNYYKFSPHNNPTGPASGRGRVARSGSWFNFRDGCRAADRYGIEPNDHFQGLGFRLVLPSR